MDIEIQAKKLIESFEILHAEVIKYRQEIIVDFLKLVASLKENNNLDFNNAFIVLIKGIGLLEVEDNLIARLGKVPLPMGLKSDKIHVKDGFLVVEKEDIDEKTSEVILNEMFNYTEGIEEKRFNALNALRDEIFPLSCIYLVAKLSTNISNPSKLYLVDDLLEIMSQFVTLDPLMKIPFKMILDDVVTQYQYEVLNEIFNVNPKMDMLSSLISKETKKKCAEIIVKEIGDLTRFVMEESPVM